MPELRESGVHRDIELLSGLIPLGMLLLDASGSVRFASAVALELLGCAGPEELSVRWPRARAELRLEAPIPVPASFSADVRVGPGQRALRVQTLPEPAGCGAVVLLRDRSRLDPYERDALLASGMRTMVHAQRLFAHDLRAPLNSIQLSLELLAGTLNDESPADSAHPWERHVTVMKDEVSRLNRILHSMAEQKEPFARVEETLDFREPLAEALRLLRPQARRQRVALDTAASPEPLPTRGSSDHLRQAMVNILAAVLQGMPAGGRAVIGSAIEGAFIETCIDANADIVDARAAQLFEQVPVPPGGGLATDLYIARRVIETHRGQMRLERGAATRFRLTLPLAGAGA